MLQDNECSTETSDYSDNDEKELYSLRNEYLQKLNIVRKRLNLAEISDDGDKYFARKCTITEIIEEDGQNVPARLDLHLTYPVIKYSDSIGNIPSTCSIFERNYSMQNYSFYLNLYIYQIPEQRTVYISKNILYLISKFNKSTAYCYS